MELLDVVDENGIPTGETVERSIAHAKGIRHRTSHVWLLRRRSEGVEVLLQKRSDNKDSFPGCYDTSSAGHIPAGVDFEDFHGAPFKDDQVSKVFYIWKDVEPEAMKLQVSEVSGVIWMPLDECRRRVRDNSMPHCILPEELDMLPF